MITAMMNGLVGTTLALGVGLSISGLGLNDILLSIFASNVAAVFSLLVTLRAEKLQWGRLRFLSRSVSTWMILTSLYFLILLWISPVLRDFNKILFLFFPLLLSSGFGLIVFGPIQDQFVRRQQRKNRAK